MRRCGSCSEENPEGARFCAFCGSPLPAGPVEERKRVSVVFVDMVGSTAYAGGVDVEDVRSTLGQFQSLVGERLASFGASVEKFIGDAAVAVFGAPAAHEDDPERAVRAAIAIRDAVIARNERAGEAAFHVRIGVHTGEALVALSSEPASGEPIATGDVMNTAARLQSAAPVDGILVGEPTHRATRDVIEYGDTAPVDAKGKPQPVPAWVALRPRARTGVDLGRHVATPLVDRRDEWAALLAAFTAASQGHAAQTVLLIGAPGIGKSRLAWELASHLESAPDIVRWRQGRTPAYGEGVTFFALAEMVKAEAGILETDGSETAAEKLRASVRALVEPTDADWVERHLRGLVGLEGGPDLRGDRRAEAFAAWRHFLDCLARRYPLVLTFEDMHWADDALLDFIEHLRTWATTRLLILVTARPELLERRPGWTSAPSATVIRVGPLPERDAATLLSAVDDGAALGPAEREQLLTQAGGNPLYALEFLRLLVDQGLLSDPDGRDAAAALPVPDSVLAIIAARIDALPAGDKAVLQDAAVVGRVFWPGAVASVTGRGVWAVTEVLRRLEDRELVRRRHDSSVQGELEYAFVHVLVRDVAYRTIVRSARAGKHRSAATWIESLGSDRRDRAGTLAHHYDLALRGSPHGDAELRSRAAAAFHEAADHALGVHAHAQAVDLSGRAIELAGMDDPRRPRLLLTHAIALALADRPALDALAEAAAALAAAGDDPGAAEADSTAAWLCALAGDMAAARIHDERALGRVADRPPSRATALVLCRAGTHRIFQPEHHLQGAALLDAALELARAQHLRDIEAEALQFAGMGRISVGDLRGREDVEAALTLALDLSSEVSLSCYGNLADIQRRLGGLDRAAELTADGLRAATRFGIAVQVRRFRAEGAMHRFWCGEWDDALLIADEYLAAIHAGHQHQMEAEMRVLRGRILLARGDLDEARAEADRAIAFARKTGHPYDVLPALAFAARMAAVTDARAGAAVDELLVELASHQQLWAALALPDVVAACTAAGREDGLCVILGRAPAAIPWTRAALAHAGGRPEDAAAVYAGIGARPEEAAARAAAARALAAHGQAGEAAAQRDAADAFWRSVGASWELQHPAVV